MKHVTSFIMMFSLGLFTLGCAEKTEIEETPAPPVVETPEFSGPDTMEPTPGTSTTEPVPPETATPEPSEPAEPSPTPDSSDDLNIDFPDLNEPSSDTP
jgi:hypothetical protein